MNNITVRWQDATHNTLVWEFPSLCTVDDIYAAGTLSSSMVATQGHEQVDIVLVLSRRVVNQGNLLSNLPPQTRRVLVVSRSMSAELLVAALRRANLDAIQVRHLRDVPATLNEAAAGD